MSADFVVVGGGIGGAVFAALASRAGKRVVVLERSLRAAALVRPEILWPRSAALLRELLPRGQWLERCATPLRGIEFHDGHRLLGFLGEAAISEPRVQPWSTDPHQTREQLLGLGDFELRRGVEVIAVAKEGQRVVGVRARDTTTQQEVDVPGHCIIGDDGARSLVRQACGIEMVTTPFPLEFLCFGGTSPASIAPGHARVWWHREALATGIVGLLVVPLPQGQCAALVPAITQRFDALSSVQDAWQRFGAVDPAISTLLAGRRFPDDLLRVQRAWGHATRYGADGAILMGDAAHPVSPAGGQGANMSIADAAALAALVAQGCTDLLAPYEQARRRANSRSIRPSRIAAWVWSAPSWMSPVSLMPLFARSVGRCPRLQRRFLRSNAGAFRQAAA